MIRCKQVNRRRGKSLLSVIWRRQKTDVARRVDIDLLSASHPIEMAAAEHLPLKRYRVSLW